MFFVDEVGSAVPAGIPQLLVCVDILANLASLEYPIPTFVSLEYPFFSILFIIFALLFSLTLLVVTQIRGHIAVGSINFGADLSPKICL